MKARFFCHQCWSSHFIPCQTTDCFERKEVSFLLQELQTSYSCATKQMWDGRSGGKFTVSNVKEIIMRQYSILEPKVSAEMLTPLMWVPPSQSHDLLTNTSTVELHFLPLERHWCFACCWDGLNFNTVLSQEEMDTVILIIMVSCTSLT